MMTFRNAVIPFAALAAGGALAALPAAVRADALFQSSVTPVGSMFRYSYTINDTTPTELADVTLENLPLGAGAISNLTAPAGFQAVFDSNLGLVDFLPGSDPNTLGQFLPGVPVSGFSFLSAFAPVTTTYSTLDIGAGVVRGFTVGPSAVPEPGVLSLVVGLGVTGAGLRRRAGKSRA